MIFISPRNVQAQPQSEAAPSLTYQIELGAGASTGEQMPFWLYANRSGMVDRTPWLTYTRLGAASTLWQRGNASVSVGGDLVARVSDHPTAYFNQLYVKGRLGAFELRVGREVETIGTTAGLLSSGSLATSLNATPLPKIVLSTPNYVAVPGTQGWVHVKGSYAHGWFERDRYVERPYLHQKTAYLRLGGERAVSVYAGLVHNAMWGGTDPELGPLPDGLNDYWRTIIADRGAEDAPPGERIYVQGNHLGIYDAGLTVNAGGYRVQAYRHFLYEDKDGLELKSMQDGLLGVAIRLPEEVGILQEVVYEHLYTKWQSGPECPGGLEREGNGGCDDYYNHGIYMNGWSHYRRTLGSPFLFLYGDPGDSDSGKQVANTRIAGHHVGLAGMLGARNAYRILVSYTRNYGTYTERERAEGDGGTYRFNPPPEQLSIALETIVRLPMHPYWQGLFAIAYDTGSVYEDRIGLMVGLQYAAER